MKLSRYMPPVNSSPSINPLSLPASTSGLTCASVLRSQACTATVSQWKNSGRRCKAMKNRLQNTHQAAVSRSWATRPCRIHLTNRRRPAGGIARAVVGTDELAMLAAEAAAEHGAGCLDAEHRRRVVCLRLREPVEPAAVIAQPSRCGAWLDAVSRDQRQTSPLSR